MSLDDFEKEELIPPLHFGCRSTLIQLSDEEVLDKNGNFRKNIKTINVELAKKHRQKNIAKENKELVDKLDKIIKKSENTDLTKFTDLTTNIDESEVILERNSKFEILDISIENKIWSEYDDGKKNKIVMKILKIE